MYAGPRPSLRARWSTETPSSVAATPVGDLAGPVGRVVVDHEHAHVERRERVEHLLDVVALVVRREADRDRGHEEAGYWMRCKSRVSLALRGTYDRRRGERCRAIPTSRTSSTSSPTCSSWRAPSRSACSPTGARRRACGRPRARSRSSRSTARRRSCRGSGRRSRRRSSRSSRRARSRRSARKKAAVPPEVVLFMRLPGLGPKTAARIWKELGVTTLDELKAAAEAERLRSARGARREVRGEDPEGARVQGGEPRRRPAAARRRAAGGAGGRRGAARASGGGARLGGRLGAPPQGDLPRPRRDRHGDRSRRR